MPAEIVSCPSSPNGSPATCARARSARSSARRGVEPGQQQRELLAADPPERAVVGVLLQAPRRLDQHAVAGAVPVRVVDGLEAVEVEQHQRERRVRDAGARPTASRSESWNVRWFGRPVSGSVDAWAASAARASALAMAVCVSSAKLSRRAVARGSMPSGLFVAARTIPQCRPPTVIGRRDVVAVGEGGARLGVDERRTAGRRARSAPASVGRQHDARAGRRGEASPARPSGPSPAARRRARSG